MGNLHRAAYNGDVEGVMRLLSEGASVNERDEAGGYTPLLWACFRARVGDYAPTIGLLISAGADVEATDEGSVRMNCLMFAVQSGSVAAVAALLALGANVNVIVDGMTALMVAGRGVTWPLLACFSTPGLTPACAAAATQPRAMQTTMATTVSRPS